MCYKIQEFRVSYTVSFLPLTSSPTAFFSRGHYRISLLNTLPKILCIIKCTNIHIHTYLIKKIQIIENHKTYLYLLVVLNIS